ncbi:uncharacterized protein BCR38DRAFT_114313 [Pseudomassariella vexata]|uniref:Uncharacterized protein n=1 Tax=Pseudomassariella vexata TaxID=1141098 RepID=A0A1Y2DBT0_9PEZI|nr:uncharacterized protein BCR38DRAFT_114313 [Pseudomassariella vexata]ORY56576.1 hypothetical protein BCR38DRAFT_114313 [Pseudomassariella vexata]
MATLLICFRLWGVHDGAGYVYGGWSCQFESDSAPLLRLRGWLSLIACCIWHWTSCVRIDDVFGASNVKSRRMKHEGLMEGMTTE